MFSFNVFRNVALALVPEISFDSWKEILEKNGLDIQKLPKQCEELCLIALNQNPFVLPFIDSEILNYSMCLNAVSKNWRVLKDVPEHYMDSKMLEISVVQSGTALQWIPTSLQSEYICLMAIVKDGEAAAVHWHNQTEDICKLVVIHDPLF